MVHLFLSFYAEVKVTDNSVFEVLFPYQPDILIIYQVYVFDDFLCYGITLALQRKKLLIQKYLMISFETQNMCIRCTTVYFSYQNNYYFHKSDWLIQDSIFP